jgi:hypothetical protein
MGDWGLHTIRMPAVLVQWLEWDELELGMESSHVQAFLLCGWLVQRHLCGITDLLFAHCEAQLKVRESV